MAVEVGWSNLALADVDEIAAYIARDSTHYAEATVQRIFAAVELLAELPQIGRVVPERKNEEYREVIVRPWRVIYKTFQDRVEVLAVVHGARLLDNAIGDRLPPNRRKRPSRRSGRPRKPGDTNK